MSESRLLLTNFFNIFAGAAPLLLFDSSSYFCRLFDMISLPIRGINTMVVTDQPEWG